MGKAKKYIPLLAEPREINYFELRIVRYAELDDSRFYRPDSDPTDPFSFSSNLTGGTAILRTRYLS